MSHEQGDVPSVGKNPLVVLTPLILWVLFIFLVVWPWIHRIDRGDRLLSILSHVSAGIWWLVLYWALHHLAFELCGLFRKDPGVDAGRPARPAVAIMYTTCDDFSLECCLSCIRQDYPSFRVLVCDDSRLPEYRRQVEEVCGRHTDVCVLVRREDRQGYKAGNLNHALGNGVREDWVLLVDADQRLPGDYLSRLTAHLPGNPSDVAFVQAAHEPEPDGRGNPLQSAMSPGIALFYQRDMGVRQSSGFVPLLGHGALVRREALEAVGGFPEVVSEDYAFALRAAAARLHGVYVPGVSSEEAFPHDFGAFMIRIRKFAGGTAELFRKELPHFLWRGSSWVEKWDLTMMLLWYILMPLVTINGFLAAYICAAFWKQTPLYLHPSMPYIYTGILLSLFALSVSVTPGWWAAVRFYFWSTAVYTAAMPVAGVAFLKGLLRSPVFRRTPKNAEASDLGLTACCLMSVFGLASIAWSLAWISPFSPFLAGQGVAYASYPLYGKLCSDGLLGKLARTLVYLPGLLFLSALYAVWRWAYL